MREEKWGGFIVRSWNGYADELMLHTHGGYRNEWGMAGVEVEDGVHFYKAHPTTITFEEGRAVIGAPNPAPVSIVSSASQVWNYTLQRLSDAERIDSMSHWAMRCTRPDMKTWDWWEVAELGQNRDMAKLAKTLNDFAYLNGHSYKVMHFLCCRTWMGASPPPSAFGVPAPAKG